MNALIRSALGLAIVSLYAMAHASPPTVNPEPMVLDPETSAKILLEKSKQRSTGAPGAASSSSSSSDCGSVNIGNSGSADKKSASGIKDMFGKQNITVVNGPVINTANCK